MSGRGANIPWLCPADRGPERYLADRGPEKVEPLSAYIKRVNGDRNEIPFIVAAVEKLEARVAERPDEDEQRLVAKVLEQYLLGEGDAAEAHAWEIAEEVLLVLGSNGACYCGHSALWHPNGERCEADPECRCRFYRPGYGRRRERDLPAATDNPAGDGVKNKPINCSGEGAER